jgi:hypothetical protein
VRSPGWVHPRRRARRRLGRCDVTWHAVDAYLTRIPGARFGDAHEALRRIAVGAVFAGRTLTGDDLYEAPGMRLVVWRAARRDPLVITVLPPKQAPGR